MRKPCRFKIWMTFRGVRRGILGMHRRSTGLRKVNRCDETLVVRRDGLTVFLQACDIAADSIRCHTLCVRDRPSIGDTTRQCRYDNGKTAFGLGTENKMVLKFLHTTKRYHEMDATATKIKFLLPSEFAKKFADSDG